MAKNFFTSTRSQPAQRTVDVKASASAAQALDFFQKGDVAQAKSLCLRILKDSPRHFDSLHLLGVVAFQQADYTESQKYFAAAVQAKPDAALAHHNHGCALMELRQFNAALQRFDKAIALQPDYADAHNSRGNALVQLNRLEEALQSYDRVVALKPDNASAYYNRGGVLMTLKRFDDAVANYDRATALNPAYAQAHNNCGNALLANQRAEDAIASYAKALALQPDYADAYFNLGNALMTLNRAAEAVVSFERCLSIDARRADVFNNRGNALRELRRLPDAIASFDSALALRPDYAEAWNNRGNALKDLLRLEDAATNYQQALALQPDYVDAHSNLGHTLALLNRLDEAALHYRKVITLAPDYPFALGAYMHTQMKLCDWTDLAGKLALLEAGILAGKKASNPFPVIALIDSPALQKTSSLIYAQAKFPVLQALPAPRARNATAKIRIGYYSADFQNHATAYLMAELFEQHDKTKFEVYGFSFSLSRNDAMRERLAAAFDKFIDVSGLSDRDVALLSREMGIDIAIDLKGHTHDARTGIFAEGCAPIQVNYLGYPGTMGSPCIHYLIADPQLIPRDSQCHFTEQLVYLPPSYQVNDSRRAIADQVFTKAEQGLPETGFVFCCFNNNYKILPQVFDIWMRLLSTVTGSVLWLLEDNATARENLCREAEQRGMGRERLVFAPRMPLAQHLARQRLADLFLDTLPCNAHTTASDALWAGLPLLTCAGHSFASRVASSLLTALELPELITQDLQQYEAVARALASDPLQLAALRTKLAAHRLSRPLFHGGLFARQLEAAYQAMLARHATGLPPALIEVAPASPDGRGDPRR